MRRHRMVVVLLDQVLPLDAAIPVHVFAREAAECYDVVTATVDGGPVAAAGGLTLTPDGGLELLLTAETVVVPGWGGAADDRTDPLLLDALRAAAARGARTVAICSGAFALARAGLLDGLTATTHWALADELARQHPAVHVDADLLYADQGRVLTSGGVTAGLDLALHLLRRDLGPSVANRVARRLVTAPHREGAQAQFVEAPPVPPGDDPLTAAQQWMLSSLSEPLTVAQMARRAHLSVRTFHRRFQERTGTSPLAWLHQQRIERSKELLETTGLSVEEIASRVGLGTAANLRVHFARATSVSPRRHRQMFGVRPLAASAP